MKHSLSALITVRASLKITFLVFLMLVTSGCGLKKEIELSGKTMGTTYHVTVVAGYFYNPDNLKANIDQRLEQINQSMSTFRKDSEISRFNDFNRADEKFAVSEDFWQVMTFAREVYQLSEGAWDGTIRPLVELWGFYRAKTIPVVPKPFEIQDQRAKIGFDRIEMTTDRHLIKKQPEITLDLASIAKGYGVDQVAAVIRKNGFEHFLVEIGGEVFAAGLRKDGRPWRVGINRPQKEAPFDQVYKIITLSNKALATSGDYRSFFEINGQRFSHILDPRNGYPITNKVASVTIIADNCTLADGLATAVMVLGPQKGLELVSRLKNVECLIIVQNKEGSLTEYYSMGLDVE